EPWRKKRIGETISRGILLQWETLQRLRDQLAVLLRIRRLTDGHADARELARETIRNALSRRESSVSKLGDPAEKLVPSRRDRLALSFLRFLLLGRRHSLALVRLKCRTLGSASSF